MSSSSWLSIYIYMRSLTIEPPRLKADNNKVLPNLHSAVLRDS